MKKYIYTLMGCAALLAIASCEKELEQTQDDSVIGTENPMVLPANIPATITATIADTKTSYDEDGKFSWNTGESGDHIYLMFYDESNKQQSWIEYKATSADATGKAVFTIVAEQGDQISALSSYTNSGVAVYGSGVDNNESKHVARPYSAGHEGYTLYKPDSEHTVTYDPFLTLQARLTGASSEVILLGAGTGSADSEAGAYTDYQFYTACAVLKVTVTGIPSEAKELRLCTSDNSNYPLNGDFAITYINSDRSVEPEISINHYRQYKYGSDYCNSSSSYIAAKTSGLSSQSFYFNVPTGVYPAGTLSINLVDNDNNSLMAKSIKSEVTFVRNDLMVVEFANQWTTLGTGKFYNKKVTNGGTVDTNWDKYYHADVVIQQNVANPNQYRVINPYGAYWEANGVTPNYTPDKYLTFTVDLSTDRVTGYNDHHIGHNLDNKSGNVYIRYANTDQNKVWQKADGKPLVVQLAPLFKYEDHSAGWDRSGSSYNHLIEILFPGYVPTDVAISSNSTSTSVCGNKINIIVSGTNVQTAKINWKAAKGSGYDFENMSTAFTASEGKEMETSGLTESKQYERYVSVQAYNSDGTEIYHDVFTTQVHVLTAADAALIVGTFLRDINQATPKKTSGASATAEDDNLSLLGGNTLSIQVSDDVSKGNIMITGFAGYTYDLTGVLPTEGLTAGKKVYGFFNGTTAEFTAKKEAADAFYTDGSTPCFISPCTESTSNKITLNYSDNSLTANHNYFGIAKTNWIGNNSGGYVIYYEGSGASSRYKAQKTQGMIPLTVSMLSAFDTHGSSGSGNEGGLASIIDKASGTNSWWSNWGSNQTTYAQGIWIQIDLGDSKKVRNFTIKFLTANTCHGLPAKYKIAVSDDGSSWADATEEINISSKIYTLAANNKAGTSPSQGWFQTSVEADGNYRYIRLCITAMNSKNTEPLATTPISLTGITTDGGHYTNLDEIQLWEN